MIFLFLSTEIVPGPPSVAAFILVPCSLALHLLRYCITTVDRVFLCRDRFVQIVPMTGQAQNFMFV